LTVDREADRADRLAGRTIGCPMLCVVGAGGDIEELFGDPLPIWKAWAEDVRVASIDSGPYIAEEKPEALAEALTDFLADPA
jgi:haloacetate dehalogenase